MRIGIIIILGISLVIMTLVIISNSETSISVKTNTESFDCEKSSGISYNSGKNVVEIYFQNLKIKYKGVSYESGNN